MYDSMKVEIDGVRVICTRCRREQFWDPKPGDFCPGGRAWSLEEASANGKRAMVDWLMEQGWYCIGDALFCWRCAGKAIN